MTHKNFNSSKIFLDWKINFSKLMDVRRAWTEYIISDCIRTKTHIHLLKKKL